MYKCTNCDNIENFTEDYRGITHIVQDKYGELISSYDDRQIDLMIVTCSKCKNNTEDGSILLDNNVLEIGEI